MSSPPILYLQNIHLTYGVTPLLEGAGLSVSAGERLCLVGRNGSGKSTLLKIAAGLMEVDKGDIFVQPGIMVAYLAQDPDFIGYEIIEDYVLEGVMDNEDQQRAYQLMADLRLDCKAPIAILSGGERRRVALAKILAPDPDILLLDEPTNHLDLPAIEWLEQVLLHSRAAIILVSHDRRFMENVSRHTLWLDRGQTKLMRRNFKYFETWRDEALQQEELAAHKLNKKIEREAHWMRYGVTARRKRNVRRMAELAHLKQQRKTRRLPIEQLNVTLTEGERSGKLVIKADKISKSFGDNHIVKDFTLQVKRGSRIGLIGANGAGKTTLLKMLTGELEPDAGHVRLGKNLTPLTLDQQRKGIKKDWTIKDALTDGAGELVSIGEETMHVIGYMKDFLFHPAQMRTPVAVLSGGEQARLLLARGLRQPSNFLILDEPTNDLDLESLDLLQELIANYEGTVLLTSHDRDFLDRTVTALIQTIDKGQWIEYAGGYSDMLRQTKVADISKTSDQERQSKTTVKAAEQNKKKPAKLSYKHKYALEILPSEITTLSTEIVALKKQLADSSLFAKNSDKFNFLANQLRAKEICLNEAETEWLELEMLREEIEGM